MSIKYVILLCMQRFFFESKNFCDNEVLITNPKILHQMISVLCMKVGDTFIALDNSGFEFLCTLQKLEKNQARAAVGEKRKNIAEAKLSLTLYQSLPKKMELFEWILQKGTEIGVSTFVPLITERTERKSIHKRDRLEKILKEATEQSERGKIPKLCEPINFEKVLEEKFDGPRVLLHSRGEYSMLSSKIVDIKKSSACHIFIGPEGGFSEKELMQAKNNDFLIASLGPRVLRTETAGVAGAAIILL